MRPVVILGAGVVGMTTAYFLAKKGHPVTVLDAAVAPGEGGASVGNGGQLSFSYTDALASPSLILNLPKYLLKQDPAFRFHPTLRLDFWRWMTSFLFNASAGRFERNTIEVLKLAVESRMEFSKIGSDIAFDRRKSGKLFLFSSLASLRKAESLVHSKNKFGAALETLTVQEATALEPALAAYKQAVAGAIWSPYDEAGDSQLFCRALHDHLREMHGVNFRFSTVVEGLKKEGSTLVAAITDKGEVSCSCVVIALGTNSARIAKTIGIRLPIWPMQGYSMTVRATARAPEASITDTANKIVFCRLGDRLRIAGLADLGLLHPKFDPQRFAVLLGVARRLFPEAGDYETLLHSWSGLRPMTPDSQPIVGGSAVHGVFINCGHGSLGWTLSMGTAARLAMLI